MAVVATGFFDGVHLGHRFVINRLVQESRRRGERSVVVTFWPHPRVVLQRESADLKLLNSPEEKIALLKALGVDEVAVIPFTRDFSLLTARAYLKELVSRFDAHAVLIGYDNRIGCDLSTPDEIARVAESLGLEVIRTDKVSGQGLTISSTKIRDLIGGGKVLEAAAMLGYNYTLGGVVVRGNQFGRTIGYPTANMNVSEPLKVVPSRGVYLTGVKVLGRELHGMCNIGVRPTVSQDGGVTVETHIFDFDEDIYGRSISLEFLRKIRDERKFPSVADLKAQLSADERSCLAFLAENR